MPTRGAGVHRPNWLGPPKVKSRLEGGSSTLLIWANLPGRLPPLGAEAIAAIHGTVAAGEERHHGVGAALGAYYRVHLAWRATETTAILVLPRTTAFGAAFRLVRVTPRREELLLSRRKGKRGPTLHTG